MGSRHVTFDALLVAAAGLATVALLVVWWSEGATGWGAVGATLVATDLTLWILPRGRHDL